jgi:hypothetical protein
MSSSLEKTKRNWPGRLGYTADTCEFKESVVRKFPKKLVLKGDLNFLKDDFAVRDGRLAD